MRVLWQEESSFSEIILKEYEKEIYFTDSVTGQVCDSNDIEIVVDLGVCEFSIKGSELLSMMNCCKNPTETDASSWLHIDSEVPQTFSTECVYCEKEISKVEESLLLSTAGVETGVNLLCSRCCEKLYRDLDRIPTEVVLSRRI